MNKLIVQCLVLWVKIRATVSRTFTFSFAIHLCSQNTLASFVIVFFFTVAKFITIQITAWINFLCKDSQTERSDKKHQYSLKRKRSVITDATQKPFQFDNIQGFLQLKNWAHDFYLALKVRQLHWTCILPWTHTYAECTVTKSISVAFWTNTLVTTL